MRSKIIQDAIANWKLARSLIASNERLLPPKKLFVMKTFKRHDCRQEFIGRCRICQYRLVNAEIRRLEEQYP